MIARGGIDERVAWRGSIDAQRNYGSAFTTLTNGIRRRQVMKKRLIPARIEQWCFPCGLVGLGDGCLFLCSLVDPGDMLHNRSFEHMLCAFRFIRSSPT